MTTIATDGKTVSCDGLGLSEELEVLSDDENKITVLTTSEGLEFLCGFAGKISNVDKLIKWIESTSRNEDNVPDTEDEFICMCMMSKPFTYHSSDFKYIEYPYAIGNGSHLAMGAMFNGAKSDDAIRIASKIDPYTGGYIRTYDLKTLEMISREKVE